MHVARHGKDLEGEQDVEGRARRGRTWRESKTWKDEQDVAGPGGRAGRGRTSKDGDVEDVEEEDVQGCTSLLVAATSFPCRRAHDPWVGRTWMQVRHGKDLDNGADETNNNIMVDVQT